jgi:hypothetical protein
MTQHDENETETTILVDTETKERNQKTRRQTALIPILPDSIKRIKEASGLFPSPVVHCANTFTLKMEPRP